jgi:hypothetical protein
VEEPKHENGRLRKVEVTAIVIVMSSLVFLYAPTARATAAARPTSVSSSRKRVWRKKRKQHKRMQRKKYAAQARKQQKRTQQSRRAEGYSVEEAQAQKRVSSRSVSSAPAS